MRLALSLAKRYKGYTHPNPTVGCVVVNKGKIVGIGFHKKAGEPHAEIVALNMARDKSKGADLYVTLEPCSHYGRTPPCTEAIVKAGIKRVFIGIRDPNPEVEGAEYLISKGIEVKIGILKRECFEINEDFFTSVLKGRPYVTLKIAQSLDGSLATLSGDSKWITSFESRRYVHRLRSYASAVLVGANTILKDNPLLTIRHFPTSKKPLRIILDPSFKTEPHFHVYNNKNINTLLIVSKADPVKEEKLERKDVEVIHIQKKEDFIDMDELKNVLISKGIINLFVEGGAYTFRKFIESNFFDKVLTFISPKLMGGVHIKLEHIREIEQAIQMKMRKTVILNGDIIVEVLNKDHLKPEYLE